MLFSKLDPNHILKPRNKYSSAAQEGQSQVWIWTCQPAAGLLNHRYKLSGIDTCDPYRLVHCSALGLVRPRVGGLPLRITYFLTPSQLLLLRQQQSGGISLTQMLTNNNEGKEDLGLSATVALEACQSPNLLPASSLVNRSNLTSRVPLSPSNSVQLCARFVLVLSKPMVIELSKCKELARSGH